MIIYSPMGRKSIKFRSRIVITKYQLRIFQESKKDLFYKIIICKEIIKSHPATAIFFDIFI